METYVSTSNYSLTWKFYSTKDGRTVDYSSTGLTDIVKAPDPVYRENPDLPQGTKKQVDWAVDGATVTVIRTVTKNGQVIHSDRFYTKYQAWGDVYEYGPGTEGIPTPTPKP
jgi:vancomycin resistance protein YoaR